MAPVGEAGTAGGGTAAGEGASSLHRKLVWLTFFRVVWVTVLLGGTAAVGLRSGADLQATAPLYPLVIGTYVASVAFSLALRRGRALVALAYAQIAIDVAMAGAVVAITGFAESVFVFMYSLAIVNGAIVLFRRGALTALGLALAAHLALVAAAAPSWHAWPVTRVFIQVAAFAVTAALASYLAELLRRTGEELAERETDLAAITALHESIVQSMTSGMLTLDSRGRITFLNRAGEQLTGLSAAALVGQPAGPWAAAFRTDVSRGEAEFTTPAGAHLLLGYSSFDLRGREGGALGTAIIFQDLTPLRAMEERVARSERLADLGRVAAGLAHELRNPLASMMGSLELLRGAEALRGEDRRLIDIALREGGRLGELVTEFLAFARPAPPRPAACDLAPLVAETLDVFANDPAAAAVTVERALAPAPASCDPAQFRQVLWNLLVNAAQAAAEPAGRRGTIRVASGSDASGAFLAVEDDGPGIDPGDRERIFLPFFTTKEHGTGLGLPTVQRIVDAHGGTVMLETRPSGGTRFLVHLPAARAAAAEAR